MKRIYWDTIKRCWKKNRNQNTITISESKLISGNSGQFAGPIELEQHISYVNGVIVIWQRTLGKNLIRICNVDEPAFGSCAYIEGSQK